MVTADEKAIPEPPAAPVVTETTTGSITVKAEPGREYSIDNGKTWVKAEAGKDTVTFDSLESGTAYEIVSRFAETDDALASGPSEAAKATTRTASSGSGGGGGSVTAYAVTVKDADNGAVTSDKKTASAGAMVTLTVKPAEGYQLDKLTVTDRNGKEIALTEGSGGTCTFTMPASDVTVTPVFSAVTSPEPEPEPDPADRTCPRDAACPISAFSDASPDQWYHDGVHWALENSVMNGIGDGLFAPNGTATRAMVVTMLWRLEGEPEGTDNPFTDVPDNKWYTQAVNWAAETGVVKGITATEFGPDVPVTREQLAAILYRCAQAGGQGFAGAWAFPLDYSDAADVSEYACEAMCWMTMHGVMNGMGDGTLAPKDNATRAQIATMFMRFCEEVSQ